MRKAVQMKYRICCWQNYECESWRHCSRKMRTKQAQFFRVLDVMLCTKIRLQPICCWLIWMTACKAVHMDLYRICFEKNVKHLHIIVSFGIDIADQVPVVREETYFFWLRQMCAAVLTFTQNGIEITSMLYKSCVWQLDTVTILWWFGELPQNQVFPIV